MDHVGERTSIPPTRTVSPNESRNGGNRLFASEGETTALLASIDWADTPLGPVETWPQTLRTSVRICLSSRHAIIVWWGPDLVFFYNDAYAPTLGIKQPWAAGKPGREVWPEIWDTIGPMLEGVLRTGEPTWSDDQRLFLERSGYLEETYHTYSYSPIEDDTGTVMGVFTAVTETTQRVLSERRSRLARDLGAALVDARSTGDVCARATHVFASAPADIPFALLYGVDSEMGRATLLGTAGLGAGTSLSPRVVDLYEANAARGAVSTGETVADPWSLAAVVQSGRESLVRNIAWHGVPSIEEPDLTPSDALVLPLIEPGQTTPTMILVAGVSPWRALDGEYRAFYSLVASHLSTGLAAAHAYEAERKRAEALAEIDRAKTAFFSNVSHEFRTPLTLMLGPLEDSLADSDEALPPRQRERLELIQRNGLRLLKLVNTLLDFARIEAGRVQAAYEPTDVALYTAELASSFRSLIEKAGMQLLVDCPPLDTLAEPVYVDREMWEKVVLNLLSNAFKFTLEGAITVSVRPHGDGRYIELLVRDTGVGIPAVEVPRLFERFHRVEGTRARTHEGSGIGLALVQELVHLHGGTIRVESVEGAGTTFFVQVPIGATHLPHDHIQQGHPFMPFVTPASTALGAEAYVGEAARWLPDDLALASLAESGQRLATKPDAGESLTHLSRGAVSLAGETQRPARIVLADDNADMCEYLARLLGEQYAVETVSNGAQALAAIHREPPQLVLSDVMMPELDGFALLRTLRADPNTAMLPVILLSARAGEEAIEEGLEAGADDYLVKPFSAREVLNRVAARLEIARIRTEAGRRTHEALEALLTLAEELVLVPSATSRRPTETLSEIGARLVVLFQRIFGCDMVSLVTLDAATGSMQPMGLAGLAPHVEAQWWSDVSWKPVQSFLAPDVIERLYAGKAVSLDLDAEPLQNGVDYDIHHILLAPMLLGETVVGLMAIEHQRELRPYTANDQALMTAIGRLCALVLERERLLREREGALAKVLALAETTRRMDEFLGIASHELRTPLTTITANVQMAGKQLSSLNQAVDADRAVPDGLRLRIERAALLLERTDRQMVRLDRLVGDLLDVSRIQAGELQMRLEKCNLVGIVQEMVREQRAAWPKRSITLDLPHHARVAISADADRIGQVVTNFLTNALKYSLDDRPVAVRVRTQDAEVRVEVRDQGPGIAVEQQAHVFERFYRVPGIEQLSGSGVGLGLGLHICKTIIERHAGTIGLDSTVDEGSTFWFSLPLVDAQAQE